MRMIELRLGPHPPVVTARDVVRMLGSFFLQTSNSAGLTKDRTEEWQKGQRVMQANPNLRVEELAFEQPSCKGTTLNPINPKPQ